MPATAFTVQTDKQIIDAFAHAKAYGIFDSAVRAENNSAAEVRHLSLALRVDAQQVEVPNKADGVSRCEYR